MLNHRVLCSGTCKGDKFPAMYAFMDKMSARPKMKEYLESDAFKNTPINGNGKQ